jgi:dihydrofolate reductase
MGKLRVLSFSLSLDGFGAGPRQSVEEPLGEGARVLHAWFLESRTGRKMLGGEGGAGGVDDAFAVKGFEGVGAWIMGRNMFGPVRGPWPDESWRGWWGEDPPFHKPVFVLTQYAREPLVMKGGTTFYFVTEGIERALERARSAAAQKDVRLGGGVATIREYLLAGLVDDLHLAYTPAYLGGGESLLEGIDLPALRYEVQSHTMGEKALHVTIGRVLRGRRGASGA